MDLIWGSLARPPREGSIFLGIKDGKEFSKQRLAWKGIPNREQ